MSQLLWLIPTLPYAGALLLMLCSGKISKRMSSLIGCSSVGISALLCILIGLEFLHSGSLPIQQTLWQWFNVAGWNPGISLHLDSLSLIFTFVITFVGFLIHVYSTGYMAHDEGFNRFFAYLNLFVGSMLMLVLADNLLLMYLGWEGVGLCSYLLIGFWYRDPENGYAARKAFVVTRVGDTAFAIGLFMLFQTFGTLQIQEIIGHTGSFWESGTATSTVIALLLLGGAVGKSAQLPLQTWLPDAMAGPTPVSALIHAATMVTAGVYLVTRMHAIFERSSVAMLIVAVIGALTLLIAGFSALCQSDLKRVLAYSTISQIGYMFLAMGLGAWSAAIFHFFTHAFFKALLFLAAGAVIEALHHEQNMFKMGGLKTKLPIVFWTFLAGAASLAALPLLTAGFYSKDQIVWLSLATENGSAWLWLAALLGAFITALYTFRMLFLTFWGEEKTKVVQYPTKAMYIPLIILAAFSIIIGFIELPHNFGHFTLLSDFLSPVLPLTLVHHAFLPEWTSQLITGLLTLVGIYIAYTFFVKKPSLQNQLKPYSSLQKFWMNGWGFDDLYDFLLVRPYEYLAQINKKDIVDKLYGFIANATQFLHRLLSKTQNGLLRWYLMGITVGALIILTISLFL